MNLGKGERLVAALAVFKFTTLKIMTAEQKARLGLPSDADVGEWGWNSVSDIMSAVESFYVSMFGVNMKVGMVKTYDFQLTNYFWLNNLRDIRGNGDLLTWMMHCGVNVHGYSSGILEDDFHYMEPASSCPLSSPNIYFPSRLGTFIMQAVALGIHHVGRDDDGNIAGFKRHSDEDRIIIANRKRTKIHPSFR